MKNIVVALDLIETDDAVIREAIRLAQGTNATLQLVHLFPLEITALDYVAYVPVDPSKRQAAIDEDEVRIKAVVADLKAKGIKAESKVMIGHTSPGILEHASEVGADAIVIGTHSRNLISRTLIGSTADKVIRQSPVPVLVVPISQ